MLRTFIIVHNPGVNSLQQTKGADDIDKQIFWIEVDSYLTSPKKWLTRYFFYNISWQFLYAMRV